jgi:hypothetical protein
VAANSDNVSAVEVILKAGADVNAADDEVCMRAVRCYAAKYSVQFMLSVPDIVIPGEKCISCCETRHVSF